MKVEKVGQQNLRVRVPRVSHQAKPIPGGMRGHPRGQTPVDFRANTLTQLPTVPLERLSWPRGRKIARWCRGDRTRCRRTMSASTEW
jgi:hypothetical protein